MTGDSGWVRLAVLAVVALWPAVLLAEETCRSGYGDSACDAREFARLAELYGVPSIEEHAARGTTVRRAFYVDGFVGDVVMVAILKERGAVPVLQVTAVPTPGSGRRSLRRLETPLSESIWNDLIGRLDPLASELNGASSGKGAALCDAPGAYVEAADMKDLATSGMIRRTFAEGCNASAGRDVAQFLANTAISQFPHCAELDGSRFRTSADLLAACTILEGHLAAAAKVANRHGAADQLDERVVMDWSGLESMIGEAAVAPFWIASTGRESNSWALASRVVGVAHDRVILIGVIGRGEPGDVVEYATFEQDWVETKGRFAIVSIKVNAFSPSMPDLE